MVGGFPFALWVAIYKGVEFLLHVPLGMARKGCHALPVDSAGFVEGDGKGLSRGVDMFGRFVFLQRALLEDSGLGRTLMLGIIVFKG